MKSSNSRNIMFIVILLFVLGATFSYLAFFYRDNFPLYVEN